MVKAKTLEPNEHGNYPCPYCSFILTPIVREWMDPPGIDYVCLRCKIMFKTKINNSLEKWFTPRQISFA